MVESNKYDNDALRWREKYFALSEEQEKVEQDHAGYLGVLQKALVRISLAADGQDNELDKHLSSLRALLRKDPVNQAGISTNLKLVETVILRLDKQRKDGGRRGEKSLLQLVEQLTQLNLSKDKQRALKRYGKSLRARAEQLNAYPELLDEYSRLQREALAESFQTMEGAQSTAVANKGLLSRIFGGRSESAENRQTTAEFEPDQSAESRSSFTNDIQRESSLATECAAPITNVNAASGPEASIENPADGVSSPGVSVADTHGLNDFEPVISVLADLLEQLPLSADERGQAEQLRDGLAVRVEAGELDRVVGNTAELVLAALDKSQRNFEQFLLTLDTQLAEINDFLGAQGQSGGTRKDVNEQLSLAVRGQVDAISQSVTNASDFNELKASVQGQLHSIVSSMDQFVATESQREHELEEQLKAMQAKLTIVQGEARVVRDKLYNETLRALTDVLTGLANREAFNERLAMERERYLRYKNSASLAILDIDHFKHVNDQHGHLVGDRVLQHVAKKLKETVRSTDFLARYGGEEFVLIMPETSLESASQVLEKIRMAVGNMSFDSVGSVTLSAGVAAFQLGEKAEQLVERADKALYQAKDKGRNRVAVANKINCL